MLRRYRYKLTGSYNEFELNDIYRVSQFLHVKLVTGDSTISELEKDYIIYSKRVFWHYTKYYALVSGIVFLISDMVHPISKWTFFPRMFTKFFCGYLVLHTGINIAYEKFLEFPMLDEVIAEGIIKYTDWVDLDKSN